MTKIMELTCQVCGNIDFHDSNDGYFYCLRCNSRFDDIVAAAIDEDDLCNTRNGGIYSGCYRRVRPTLVTPTNPVEFNSSKTMHEDHDDDDYVGDGIGPKGPSDFGSLYPMNLGYEEYCSQIRLRYVMGFQIMIQMQCKALVENFDVSPVIVGLVGPIWLRFLAYTRVMADDWADQVLHKSETKYQGEVDALQCTRRYSEEPHNILGQRAVMIWYRSLRSTIPLSYSLAISLLICHMAREAILPTDILKGTLEGKIPYFAAFVEIEKQLGPPPAACPISSSLMFRPTQVGSLQKLEFTAACIAQKICLDLPPVNFNAIASRYLQELSLPVSKILPVASCIYEWSMPPELYLSANELRLPSRVRVMSILIVAIRMVYDINGYGKWELTMSSSRKRRGTLNVDNEYASKGMSLDDSVSDKRPKDFEDPGLDAVELLKILEVKYNKLCEVHDTFEHSKDLPSYLQNCKDIVFAGLEPSFEDLDEEKMIEDLWNFYQNQKGPEPSEAEEIRSLGVDGLQKKRSRGDSKSTPKDSKNFQDTGFTCDTTWEDGAPDEDRDTLRKRKLPVGWYRGRAIRSLRHNMEENRFCYIPPRINAKEDEYIYYSRKKKEGMYIYAVHADYYILLRSCAKVTQVDVRTMHIGVLTFERRLQQLEERMNKL